MALCRAGNDVDGAGRELVLAPAVVRGSGTLPALVEIEAGQVGRAEQVPQELELLRQCGVGLPEQVELTSAVEGLAEQHTA